MQTDEGFPIAYRRLEERMTPLAEADGDAFLPNPEPSGRADYILICMEPSLGGWAHRRRGKVERRSRVQELSVLY